MPDLVNSNEGEFLTIWSARRADIFRNSGRLRSGRGVECERDEDDPKGDDAGHGGACFPSPALSRRRSAIRAEWVAEVPRQPPTRAR